MVSTYSISDLKTVLNILHKITYIFSKINFFMFILFDILGLSHGKNHIKIIIFQYFVNIPCLLNSLNLPSSLKLIAVFIALVIPTFDSGIA